MILSKSEKRYVADAAYIITLGDKDHWFIVLPKDCDNIRLAELDKYAETLVKNET